MRLRARMAWAAVVAAAGVTPAFGQTAGTGSGTSGGSSIDTSGSSLSGGSGGLSGGLGGSGGSGGGAGGGASTGSALQGTALTSMQQAPTLTAPSSYSTTGGTTNAAINSSNFLGPTYGNVYYQGRSGAQLTQAPGGFGVTLYGNNGGTGGGNIGFAGAGSGGFGGASGAGGNGGGLGRSSGGLGGSSGSSGVNLSNPGGQIVQLPRAIAYPAILKFVAVLPAPAQVNAEIRGMLDRSAMLGSPQSVQVFTEGNVVVLRGNVRDEDESHMVEGMIRLTPGVHAVKNELIFPQQ